MYMKKLSILIFIIGCISAQAQVSLEKQFNGQQITAINLSSTYYYFTDIANSKVYVYKEDYSLYNTFVFTPPSGYKFSTFILSDKLFNLSADLEFLVIFSKTGGSTTDSDATKLILYNEKGLVLYDFGVASILSPSFIKTASGSSKMMLLRMIYNTSTYLFTTNTEIYNISGGFSGISSTLQPDKLDISVDQTNKMIKFNLNSDEIKFGILRIYNLQGNLLKYKSIKGISESTVLISTQGLASDIYIYELNGIVGKFIIK